MVKESRLVKGVFSNIPEDKHLAIVGAPKCGTNSLQKYLKTLFPDKEVIRTETLFKGKHGVDDFKKNHSNKVPIIITRNDVDRIWSQYHYFDLKNRMTLKEYLEYNIRDKDDIFKGWGKGNPIKQAQWKYWIDIWKELNPIIVTLEECMKLEGFPHDNKTELLRSYPKINKEERELIEEALKNG